jgi:hypothetical protein
MGRVKQVGSPPPGRKKIGFNGKIIFKRFHVKCFTIKFLCFIFWAPVNRTRVLNIIIDNI